MSTVQSFLQRRTRTLAVAEGGMAVALSWGLSYFKLFSMPQGGSVSLEMVPIFILAARWGMWHGVVAGVASGILQGAFGGYVVHWAQALLDYPVAFGILGVAGLSRWPELGVVIGSVGRLAAHWLSGVVFFASYAPAGQPVALYSLVYNASFLVPEAVITLVVVAALRVRTTLFRRAAGSGRASDSRRAEEPGRPSR